jgi:hypothetical protein
VPGSRSKCGRSSSRRQVSTQRSMMAFILGIWIPLSTISVVGAENLCYLGRCLAEYGRFGPAFGAGQACPGQGGMIFGLWA